MSWLTELLISLLGIYLAFTNVLANGVEFLLMIPSPAERSYSSFQDTALPQLPSDFTDTIPSILLQSPGYQNASLIGAARLTPTPVSVAEALVNIYCTYETDKYVRTTTGSGFFIDSAGVILTNAHVAQFLLLEDIVSDAVAKCVIRAGNPAVALYEAELLYIPPAWVQKNASQIAAEAPSGTGERDYALLFVTAGLDNRPLPARFPALPINTALLTKDQIGEYVTLAGYPNRQGETGAEQEQVSTMLTNMYTFGGNSADVLQLASSSIGHSGVSGGPVVNQAGEVVGLISTRGSKDPTDTSLRAITLAYIDRTMIEESTFSLERTMSGHLAFRSRLFMETIVPFLSRLLAEEL